MGSEMCIRDSRDSCNYFFYEVGYRLSTNNYAMSYNNDAAEIGIEKIPLYYQNITVDKYVIMPNHVHLIIRIDNNDINGRPMTAPTVCNCISFSALRLRKKYTVTINAMNALGTNLS